MDNTFIWPHKDLLDVTQLTPGETLYLLDLAEQFHEVNTRPVKKVPTLRGKGVVLFFAEDSTRTKTSFDMAGKRLSADTFSLGKSGSSMNKGESLKDTALTLEAMNPDVIVIRHRSSGAAQFIAERLACSVINAGDGWHAHPTQALLDLFALRRHWNGELEGRSLLIMGDLAHSRVARSNIHLLSNMGVSVRLFAPRTLLPAGVDRWPATVYADLAEALTGVDGVMCLRLQRERMAAGLMPDISEYSSTFCLNKAMMRLAKPGAPVLHPGPINRGTDIAADLADSVESLILKQVNAGVAIRMAVLLALCTRNGGLEE
ncbi:MAG: aspartate carbamoyltransferase catalytic subunit [Deltaproteobacteria bacterium]|jgi:aspartate carbamoyltransferase catalytic subunit|nr:aspartate carbamoyltransferase catalytic subunit [Deltaproteobacteria bacterium]